MPPSPTPPRPAIGSFALIGAVVVIGAAAFAYTAGWLSPARVTPEKLVDGLAPPNGPSLGHRRNHAKGICFTGEFQAGGAGTALSTAAMLRQGSYPIIGRFNLATANAGAADASVPVHGIGLQIAAPDGQVWRSAMLGAPVFPVATVEGFYELLQATHAKDPNAMKGFVAAHPEFANFVKLAPTLPRTASYAEDRFNSLNSFTFTDAAGKASVVRWSLVPAAALQPVTPAELASRAPNFLESEITDRVAKAPQRWEMVATVAGPGDKTSDPSTPWPADRRSVSLGTLVVNKIEAEADGPCRDLNFDPTVLPSGMSTSDDPFPAARSAAYAVSFDRRTAEAADYPRTGGAK